MPNIYYPTDSERLAASAWRRLDLEPPVDLARVCEFLRVDVSKRLMMPDLHGIYIRDESGHAQININSGLPATRQRFTWAHEIGHHLFNRKIKGTIMVEFRTNQHHQTERECDLFAVCLLMPADKVIAVARELHHPDRHDKTGTIAARFGVSLTAMRIRLRELGLSR